MTVLRRIIQPRRPVIVRRPAQTVYYYSTPSYQYVPPVTYVQPQPTYGYPAPYYNGYSDQSILAAVAQMLAFRFPGQIHDLELAVDRGEVEIEGEVRSSYIRHLILQSIQTIPGVRSVDSDLDVDD